MKRKQSENETKYFIFGFILRIRTTWQKQ